ncbi:hypothetical protein N7495_000462 [Penicillium taxi]|uniref:uncharacterized protein n=1 Tax=Penicillium taxi TaxID=168475 RepID=UPI0025457EE1|nr:uncharacterized protein N7495_000462 [Penicillium taxi]KAJ5907780.1 hypothetical protein N7495_000462 [Penicillium taxi]
MAQFMRDPEVVLAEIIAIQEPWRNSFKDDTHHLVKQTHDLYYLFEAETGARARVCLFISKKMALGTHIVHSADCQEYQIKTEEQELRIINIYNKGGTLAMNDLEQILRRISYLVIGDFNLHHPAWGGDGASQDLGSDDLLDQIDIAGLDLWLRPGTTIWRRGGEAGLQETTIDLVLASYALRERMIACETKERIHADSDHLPILTTLEINTPKILETRRRQWKKMDISKFIKFVSENLKNKLWMHSPELINESINHLLDIV